jgi:hypothetical protein
MKVRSSEAVPACLQTRRREGTLRVDFTRVLLFMIQALYLSRINSCQVSENCQIVVGTTIVSFNLNTLTPVHFANHHPRHLIDIAPPIVSQRPLHCRTTSPIQARISPLRPCWHSASSAFSNRLCIGSRGELERFSRFELIPRSSPLSRIRMSSDFQYEQPDANSRVR